LTLVQYDLVWKTVLRRKKVAMALAELITQDIKDTLDILVFGNDAWTIAIKICRI
jgi:uncharacterized protein with von Willebrand factor type A (vWA) domain